MFKMNQRKWKKIPGSFGYSYKSVVNDDVMIVKEYSTWNVMWKAKQKIFSNLRNASNYAQGIIDAIS